MNTSYIVTQVKKESYVQDNNGDVFKVMPTHLLKLSPWKDGEDRRVYETDLGDYTMITYKNACMIVNNQFDKSVETWERKGKKYIANSLGDNINVKEHSYLLSTLPNHKIVLKDAERLLKHGNSISITSEDGNQELKLVKHKGKVYYIMIVKEFLPRVKAYNMFGEFVQWIGIEHAKPIFCETDERYI